MDYHSTFQIAPLHISTITTRKLYNLPADKLIGVVKSLAVKWTSHLGRKGVEMEGRKGGKTTGEEGNLGQVSGDGDRGGTPSQCRVPPPAKVNKPLMSASGRERVEVEGKGGGGVVQTG